MKSSEKPDAFFLTFHTSVSGEVPTLKRQVVPSISALVSRQWQRMKLPRMCHFSHLCHFCPHSHSTYKAVALKWLKPAALVQQMKPSHQPKQFVQTDIPTRCAWMNKIHSDMVSGTLTVSIIGWPLPRTVSYSAVLEHPRGIEKFNVICVKCYYTSGYLILLHKVNVLNRMSSRNSYECVSETSLKSIRKDKRIKQHTQNFHLISKQLPLWNRRSLSIPAATVCCCLFIVLHHVSHVCWNLVAFIPGCEVSSQFGTDKYHLITYVSMA